MSKQTKSWNYYVNSKYVDVVIGIETKSQFQHNASNFFFVKNTKLQLHESIMQNLNENHLVRKFNMTHTNTLHLLDKKISPR